VSNESQEGREALDLIGTTGAYGVEAVSSRIFEYAQYVGGDLSAFFQKTYDGTRDKLQDLGE